MQLTASTTRAAWSAHLHAAYETTVKNGGNQAILRHALRVDAMDDAAWAAYKAEKLAQDTAPQRAAAARMVAGLFRR